ncbi:hypothetical protein Q5P01_018646 [Channa striata]|uniref:Uncharacterized protein n=1 Tax=Channa striata TaxID=64152 RepID=A0AA88M581_CHASR|nr:hypothetical protein Q5P01_018646 [Channa striata]
MVPVFGSGGGLRRWALEREEEGLITLSDRQRTEGLSKEQPVRGQQRQRKDRERETVEATKEKESGKKEVLCAVLK